MKFFRENEYYYIIPDDVYNEHIVCRNIISQIGDDCSLKENIVFEFNDAKVYYRNFNFCFQYNAQNQFGVSEASFHMRVDNKITRHSEYRPALIECNSIYYFNYDKYHREDGPAIIHPNGNKEYFQNGLRHRLDGPAVIRKENKLYSPYYLFGESFSEKDIIDILNLKCLETNSNFYKKNLNLFLERRDMPISLDKINKIFSVLTPNILEKKDDDCGENHFLL